MTRSRVVAATASVGAFVVLTAGVAVANPGTDGSSRQDRPSNDDSAHRAPSADDGSNGDRGWWQPGDRDGGSQDPGGFSSDPGQGPGWPGPSQGFDPGTGGGSGNTRSGGS